MRADGIEEQSHRTVTIGPANGNIKRKTKKNNT